MESLKQFLGNGKAFIKRIVGLEEWTDPPAMSLEQIKDQTKAMLGETDQFATPDISLAATRIHVDTNIGTPGTAHGITGFGASSQPLAATQSPGVATTVSRGDHVHPLDATLLSIGGLTPAANTMIYFPATDTASTTGITEQGRTLINQSSYEVMGGLLGVVPPGTYNRNVPNMYDGAYFNNITVVNGLVTGVSTRTMTLADIGALSANSPAASITALGGTTASLGWEAYSGSGTKVALSNHIHPYPTPTQIGAAASVHTHDYLSTSHPAGDITGFAYVLRADAKDSSAGTSNNVARADHVHPFPLAYGCRPGSGGSIGTSSFNINWSSGAAYLWIDTTNCGQITLTSDYRIKQHVANIAAGALDRVLQLRPISYRYKNIDLWSDDGKEREGFIAHELAEVVPGSVNGTKDAVTESGGIQPQTLDLSSLVAVLTAAMQELTAEVRGLADRVATLEQ